MRGLELLLLAALLLVSAHAARDLTSEVITCLQAAGTDETVGGTVPPSTSNKTKFVNSHNTLQAAPHWHDQKVAQSWLHLLFLAQSS